jgi:hypothetical protein
MRGFSSFSRGAIRLIGIPCLPVGRSPPPHPLHGGKAAPSGLAFCRRRPWTACPAFSGPSLRQAGDSTFMLNDRLTGDGTGDLTGTSPRPAASTPPPPPWWSMRTGWTSRARPFANAPPSGRTPVASGANHRGPTRSAGVVDASAIRTYSPVTCR